MEWLSEWIRQIILLVLIATFIDLLLPNQSFDRYVKLVMGLLIIMAILTPILQLVNKDLDLSSISSWKTNDLFSNSSMDSLQKIQGGSKQIQQFQTKQIQDRWERNMEQLMRSQLSKQFSFSQVDVTVEARLNKQEAPQINHVKVQIHDEPNRQHEPSTTSTMVQTMPIDSIEVEVKEQQTQSTAHHPMIGKIKKYIEETWNIQSDQIDVRVAPKV